MPGFDNNVVYAANLDFSTNATVTGQMTTDGQLLIGSSAAPHIRVSTLSVGSGLSLTNGNGSILLDANTPATAPIGSINLFSIAAGDAYISSYWKKCDGSILTQALYPSLYTQLGLLYPGASVWTIQTSGTTTSISSLIYGNGLFVYGGYAGKLATSTDAVTWTARTSGTISVLNSLTYGNGLYLYGGSGNPTAAYATSTDAVTWTARTCGTATQISALTYGNSIYVSGSAGGLIQTSTDGIAWTSQTSGTSSGIYSLLYSGSLYVYGGIGGALATSTDAITWTARTSGTTSTIVSLLYNSGLYLYASGTGLFTSTDAITWANRTTTSALGLAYGNGVYVAYSYNNSIITSTDGITWNPTSGLIPGTTVVFTHGANYFVGAGSNGVVSRALDTYTYNPATQFQLPVLPYTLSGPLIGSNLNLAYYIKSS